MICNFFQWLIWLVLTFICAPLLPGIINKVKAFFAGRRGPSVFQLYYDIFKLLRKESVISNTSGGVIFFAPAIILATLAAAALLLPYGASSSPFSFTGDIILFFYLMGCSRVAMIFGAMDTGSSFEGMGSSREAHFSALAEAAVFGVIGFLALGTGRCETDMLTYTGFAGGINVTSLLLAAAAFFIVLLMENCRVPADDPDTHLELTMIHEAMVLDYGGPELAAVFYAGALKLWLFVSFFVMMLMPAGKWSFGEYSGVFTAGILISTVLVGCIESCMARYRFLKVPQMLAGALCIALLAVFFLAFFEGAAR